MRKIDIEALIDYVQEEMDSYGQYMMAAKRYDKDTHGYYTNNREDEISVNAIIDVLNLNRVRDRLYTAARIVRRWREMTEYQLCIPSGMQDQLEHYLYN